MRTPVRPTLTPHAHAPHSRPTPTPVRQAPSRAATASPPPRAAAHLTQQARPRKLRLRKPPPFPSPPLPSPLDQRHAAFSPEPAAPVPGPRCVGKALAALALALAPEQRLVPPGVAHARGRCEFAALAGRGSALRLTPRPPCPSPRSTRSAGPADARV